MVKIELANTSADKDAEQLFDLRTKIARAIDPYESKGADLQFCHLGHVNTVVQGVEPA